VNNSVLLKWGLCLLIVSFVLVIGNSCISASQGKSAVSKSPPVEKKQPSKLSDEKLPEIFLETAEYDSDAVYEGAVVTHTFNVKNKGKGDLLIKKVRPG
jgi:hypothetical protein